MINKNSPYTYTAIPTLMDGTQLTVFLPPIGKTAKPKQVSNYVSDPGKIKPLVHSIVTREVKDLVRSFLASKEKRFQTHLSNQRIEIINALSALRLAVMYWDRKDFATCLKGEILPLISLLRTANTTSPFYQYDKDLFDFCEAVSACAIVNVITE